MLETQFQDRLNQDKAVVTGIGLIGAFGQGPEAFWETVLGQKPALGPVTQYPFDRLAGEIRDFHITKYTRDRRVLRSSRIAQMAIAAAQMALEDAKIDLKAINTEKFAVFFGTDNGASKISEAVCRKIIEKGHRYVDPILFQHSVFNSPASLLSILWSIKGPCVTLPMGIASGGAGLSMATNYLYTYDYEYALVIAADEMSEVAHRAYDHLRLLSPNNEHPEGMRPFDQDCNGFVVSEGAAAFIIEKTSNTEKRCGRIHAELAGLGMAGSGSNGIDGGDEGVALAMTNALQAAGVAPDKIDLIIGMANSIKEVDSMEMRGIVKALSRCAEKIPVTSIKSSIGESFSPSALFNLAVCILSMKFGVIPPTLNCVKVNNECNLDVVRNTPRRGKVGMALANSYSWGGLCHSILVRNRAGTQTPTCINWL